MTTMQTIVNISRLAPPTDCTRRQLLWTAFSAAAAGLLLSNGGCMKGPETTGPDFQRIADRVGPLIKQYRPDWEPAMASRDMPALPDNFDALLEQGRRTVVLVRELLKLKDTVNVGFTDSFIATGPCLYIDGFDRSADLGTAYRGEFNGVPEYKELARKMCWIREASARELRALKQKVDDASMEQKAETTGVESVLLVKLSTQLRILADRIENKTLLAGENIINFRHKTGDTSELVGRTEYLEESIDGLEQLYRVRKAARAVR